MPSAESHRSAIGQWLVYRDYLVRGLAKLKRHNMCGSVMEMRCPPRSGKYCGRLRAMGYPILAADPPDCGAEFVGNPFLVPRWVGHCSARPNWTTYALNPQVYLTVAN